MRRGEYPDDWDERRERVLERDDHQCQECGETDATLQVHHMTPISEGGSHDLGNLQTVCKSCHASEHQDKIKLREAITEQQRIRMKYRSSSGTRVREVEPYALQMHQGIQYLVGHDHYRDEVRHFRPTRIEWVETTNKTYNVPSSFSADSYLSTQLQDRNGESSCFIATASYGTPYTEEIDLLREFRDKYLLTNSIGSIAVELYYSLSPPVAAWIAKARWRRVLARVLVISPALWVVSTLPAIRRPDETDDEVSEGRDTRPFDS